MPNLKLTWLLALLLVCTPAFASDFDKASELYDAGKFPQAQASLQQLVDRKEWSANLFFNLGNTQFRLNSPGLAALNYERALALEPAHPEATRNLQFVRERSGAHLPESPWFDKLFPPCSLNFWILTTSVAFWIFVVSLILLKRLSSSSILLTVSILSAITALYSGTAYWLNRHAPDLAIVVANQTEARLAPADRAATAESLPAASRVYILSERGDWIYCQLPKNGRGWIPAAALQRVALPAS